MASKNGGNTTAAYDPRQIWATNLAPLVIAAREGASQAARTASRERARARRRPAWWRQRWVIVTASGLAIAGAAGGVYAAMAGRRSAHRSYRDHAGSGTHGMPAGNHDRSNGVKSTMESSRSRVGDMARSMVHKLRGDEHRDYGAAQMPGAASTKPGGSRNQLHSTETGYPSQS